MKFKFKRERSIGKIKLKLERLTGKSSVRLQLPEFKSGLWNLSGGAYLNKSDSLVFENEKSRAESPFIGVDGNLITLSFMSEDDGKMYGIIQLFNEGKNKIREYGYSRDMKMGEKFDLSYALPEDAKFAKIILMRHSAYAPDIFSLKEAGVKCRFIAKNAGGGVVNELPPFNTYLWNTFGNAYINEKGNLVIPDLTSSANIILKWPRKTKIYRLIAELEEGITAGRFYLTYLDKDLKSLTAESASRKDINNNIFSYTFGGENYYGEKIYSSEYIKIQFDSSEELAPPPIEIKNIRMEYK